MGMDPARSAGVLINLDVPDLARAEAFYTQVFGLRVGRRFGPRAVELLGAAAPLYLLENPAGSRPLPSTLVQREYARHWTPVHLDFVVTDIERVRQLAQAAGASLEGAIRDESFGRIAQLADPFGHGVCVIEITSVVRASDFVEDDR